MLTAAFRLLVLWVPPSRAVRYGSTPSALGPPTPFRASELKSGPTSYLPGLEAATQVTTLTAPAQEETWRFYYYLNGQRVAMREVDAGGENVLYLAGDHLGSTSVALDANGVKGAESRYHPYGQERWSNSTLPTDYRFTGQQQIDSAGGIYHMGARFYDPSLARWLSADTIAPDPSNPQSLNRYSWVLGNPLKYVDPTGHKEEGACSDPNEECIDDEIYDAYWAYCTQNPDDAACQPGDVGEAVLFFLAGVSGMTLLEDLVTIGVGSLWEAIKWTAAALCLNGNCTDEAKTLVDFARNLQGTGQYPGVDDFTATVLEEGQLVAGGAPGQSNFYTIVESVEQSGKSATTLFQGLQVAPHEVLGYRPGVTIYRVVADTPVAIGQALANPQYGPGGYVQIVIKNFNEVLEPLYSIPLH